jgi:hypothetical protein
VRWVERIVEEQIDSQITGISNAKSKIHLWIDGWSSPNRTSILAIGATYLSHDNQIKTPLLSLREIIGQHTGANQAIMVMDTINKYAFTSNLGYLVMDNAASNDTLIRELSICK